MKSITFISLCFIGIITTSKCHCQVSENFTITYGKEDDIYVEEFSKSAKPRLLTYYYRDVTSLAIHNDDLYVSRRETDDKYSTIRRYKVSTDSKSFKIENTSGELFHVVNEVEEDILSMVIAERHVYSGCSDGVLWRRSADKKYECEKFQVFLGWIFQSKITEIDYNPDDGQIYTMIMKIAK